MLRGCIKYYNVMLLRCVRTEDECGVHTESHPLVRTRKSRGAPRTQGKDAPRFAVNISGVDHTLVAPL